MKKKWVLKPFNLETMPIMPEYPEIIRRLLAIRGFSSEDKVSEFLNPDYSKLLDPFLFKDMQRAVERIWQAVEKNEKIYIYSDYDADAITACSVLCLALKKMGGMVDAYIPDRFTEGYGVNQDAIRKIKEAGASVVITVDCGTNSVEEAKLAQELGMDFVITDHHEITGELPKSFALINPKNSQDNFPFPFITGVGVAFKLVQGLLSANRGFGRGLDIPEGWEKWLLDLVCIGTVADCQNLESENRILVKFGLKVMEKTRWPGLRALIDIIQIDPSKLSTYTVGFMLAPRINAAGRIKHADVAFRLLVSENILEAQNYAIELNQLNAHRQTLTEQILSEARAQIELVADKKVLLAAGKDWPKGVVGLVAGRISEEYGRPVLIMEKGEEFATGSARSIPQFDIVKALGYAKDLLQKYGGHTQAAGFTLPVNNIGSLYAKLLEFADTLDNESILPTLEVDAEMTSKDLNWELYEHIQKFEPFGFGNTKPKFWGKNFKLIDFKLVGANSQHLKMRVMWGEHALSAIAFNKGFLATKFTADPFDMIFELESNEWNGNKELQLKVVDVNLND